MTALGGVTAPIRFPDRLYIGGQWVTSSSGATIDVIDSGTEELYFRVAAADDADMDRAIGAARTAFDEGPWPRLSHGERAQYLRALASALSERAADIADLWPRESGVLHAIAATAAIDYSAPYDYYAGLAETFPFEEEATPTAGDFGLVVREPVGVVGAIVPWNGALGLLAFKLAPALLAGCTVVIKAPPASPGDMYVIAEVVESIGLPAGVVNVVTADREVSARLVRDPRIDKIAFTGSTEVGRFIATTLGNRIGRYTLELGGKSAALILDDADIDEAAVALAGAETYLSGQACSSLTRIIVSKHRHDAFTDALTAAFSAVQVGDPFEASSQMGPLATAEQRERVEGFIAAGIREGARLTTGGKRPRHLSRGFYIEPTVFANVDNASTIAQNEIFGPVLSVLPADDERHAVQIANDSIYGLNASVFTPDIERAYSVARQLRSGTVGHNAWRTDFGIAFGGFKQSGIGREGGIEGLRPYLEVKAVVLDGPPEHRR